MEKGGRGGIKDSGALNDQGMGGRGGRIRDGGDLSPRKVSKPW